MGLKLTFFGAAQQVTGSMFLVEIGQDYRILVDCGTDMEKKDRDSRLFPFDPNLINVVLLTHAHIDHSGQIPNLFVEGFEGQILCTSPTLDLAEILLYDAASLHSAKIKSIQKKKKYSKKDQMTRADGLYLSRQVAEAVGNMVPLEFNRRFKLTDKCWVTFIPAGHLLGAAHILLEVEEDGSLKKLCFSGDIGRKDYPLLVNPERIPEVDYLICETTYGARNHTEKRTAVETLKEVIQQTCVDIPGRLIIPTFSVGRTQALLYTLKKLYEEEGFEPIKVFTDSPLGKESTRVHQKYYSHLNQEARQFLKEYDDLFDFENLEYVSNPKLSKEINNFLDPCIIISSSGMVQGGRIEHHVAANLENPYATLFFIGFATEGSLGHKLRNMELKQLHIQGSKKEVLLNIQNTDVFSGHGDQKDLLEFIDTQKPDRLQNIFLVHGELDSMHAFKEIVENRGFKTVTIPQKGDTFEL